MSKKRLLPRKKDRTGPYVCAVTECGDGLYARGYCRRHYLRWQAYGNPRVASTRGMHHEHPRPPVSHHVTCECAVCRLRRSIQIGAEAMAVRFERERRDKGDFRS